MIGPSSLTYDALRKHDAIQGMGPPISKTPEPLEEMEHQSESECSTATTISSINTFASDWSACTNMSFNKFLKVFQPSSAIHKNMLAALAAITEVIKEHGGTGTSVEYYCSLVIVLLLLFRC